MRLMVCFQLDLSLKLNPAEVFLTVREESGEWHYQIRSAFFIEGVIAEVVDVTSALMINSSIVTTLNKFLRRVSEVQIEFKTSLRFQN